MTGVQTCALPILFKDGRCVVEPGAAKAGHFLKGGERVALEVPEIEPMEAVPEDIPLTILHEDRHLIAIDKPPRMVVHPAIGHARGTLVNAILGRYGSVLPNADGSSEAWRPGIVHRLDQDTSGVILVARTTAALTFLQDAFKARTVIKRYLAYNSSYWLGKKYIGIGPSAHSYNGFSRSWNVSNNSIYIKSINENKLPSETENLTIADKYNEYIMTGLRTIWGVSLQRIETDFGSEYLEYLLKNAQKYLNDDLLNIENNILKPTQKGKFLCDGISSDLFFLNSN